MALPVNGSTHLIPAFYYSFIRPRKDERLSWPSWLTCSGWFTHISGDPSAAGRAQDREVRQSETDVLPTVLRHQPHTAWQQANSRGRALQRPRIVNDWQPIIRRGIRSGLCDPDHMSLEDLVNDAGDRIFNLILYRPQ